MFEDTSLEVQTRVTSMTQGLGEAFGWDAFHRRPSLEIAQSFNAVRLAVSQIVLDEVSSDSTFGQVEKQNVELKLFAA